VSVLKSELFVLFGHQVGYNLVVNSLLLYICCVIGNIWQNVSFYVQVPVWAQLRLTVYALLSFFIVYLCCFFSFLNSCLLYVDWALNVIW